MKLKASIKTDIKEFNAKQLWAIKKNYGLTETEVNYLIAMRNKYDKNASQLLGRII